MNGLVAERGLFSHTLENAKTAKTSTDTNDQQTRQPTEQRSAELREGPGMTHSKSHKKSKILKSVWFPCVDVVAHLPTLR